MIFTLGLSSAHFYSSWMQIILSFQKCRYTGVATYPDNGVIFNNNNNNSSKIQTHNLVTENASLVCVPDGLVFRCAGVCRCVKS